MSGLSRRTLLVASAASLISACEKSSAKRFAITKTTMNKIKLSDEDFTLLMDVEARRRVVGDGPLVIRDRYIGGGGDSHRLDDVSLEDIEFVDCMFLGHMMFDVNMKHLRFTRCGFSGVRWEGGRWSNLTFKDCGFLGKGVSILPGGGDGESMFERCYFQGTEPDSPQHAGAMRLYGTVGVGGKSRYVDCEMHRLRVFIDTHTEVVNCKVDRILFSHRFEHGAASLLVDQCTVENDMDMPHAIIASLTLRNSSFHRVDASRMSGGQVTLEKVTGSFEFFRSQLSSLSARECTFTNPLDQPDREDGWGLGIAWVDVNRVLIEKCSFKGKHARLLVAGAPPKRDGSGNIVPYVSPKTGKVVDPYTTIDSLTIKDTPIASANFSYTQIEQFAVENTTLTDTLLPHSKVGKLFLKNVTLSGTLDFSDTQVKEVVVENVAREKLKLVTDKNSKIAL